MGLTGFSDSEGSLGPSELRCEKATLPQKEREDEVPEGLNLDTHSVPQTLYGVLDQSVELRCLEINSSVTFIWSFITLGTNRSVPIAWGDLISEDAAQLGVVSLIDSTLVIDKLTLQAEGQFTCVVKKGVLLAVYIDLVVLVPVVTPTFTIDKEKPIEGTEVHMACTVEVGTRPVTYIWQRHTVFEGTSKVQEGTDNMFVLSPVTRAHTGWYTCTVRNVVSEKTSGRLSLDVVYGPDEPTITIEPYAISENGFAANEMEKVILNCTASSNPPCEYIWFYNNSQLDTGQMYIFPRIIRTQTGLYTCLAKNLHLDTRTQLTIRLTVYYLPEGQPSCTALPHNRFQNVALWCSWPGGLPLAQLYWMKQSEEDSIIVSKSNATLIKSGADMKNRTTFYCSIFHPSLKKNITCSTTVVMPSGGPNCSAVATKLNEFIMLTCEWTGGLPRITLMWNYGIVGDIKESSNIYVFKPDRTYNGKLFICAALHPMIREQTECHIQLEAPVLDSPSMANSILEGNSAYMICNLKSATPSSEITWYDNNNQEIISDSQKYGIFKEDNMSNLTVREPEWGMDSGLYRCMASNAVGNTSLLIRLDVNKYPTPPNVSISKLLYSRQRTEVDVEWMTQGAGDLTGFMVQRQASIRSTSPRRSVQTAPWDIVANDIEPEIRGHKLAGLDPSILYAFRILAVNHKTTGFPSEVKTPADPPNNIYPVAIGAGFAGMLVAVVVSLLVFQYIARNRQNHPRLHDWFFRASAADARENIRHPEDAETAVDTEEGATASPETTPEPAPTPEPAQGNFREMT
ncbi:V-set and immunoglobulin domain-containing protein 10-like 2 [Rana temporaria]|uniref:V-set and immunoglobulin domain-containing protein 10-like 2 n=1 Tax=Rana temporaria TaxID=8407 RepID=UPI001AACE1E7|nr:V-set and immunoglobulin domain-containing protein 10-like 2 [Rana temporaria]